MRLGWLSFLGCMLAAAAVRFSPVHRAAGAVPADYRVLYLPLARNLVAGKGYVDAAGEFVTRVPPGYPFYVAACLSIGRILGVSGDIMVAAADVLCAGLVGWLLWLLGARLWDGQAAAIAAGAWALYPVSLWLYSAPSTEAPYMVFLMLELILVLRVVQLSKSSPWLAFACGAVGGVGALIRPFAIGLPVLFAVWTAVILWRSGRSTAMALATLMLLGYAVSVAPWEAFAYARTGRVIPLSTAGAPTMRDGLTFAVNPKAYRRGVNVPPGILQVMADIRRATTDRDTPGHILGVVANEFGRQPLRVTGLILLKVARSFYGTDSQRHEAAAFMIQVLCLVALGASWMRARRTSVDARRAAELTAVIVIYSLAMDVLGASIARYIVPALLPGFLLLPALWLRRTRSTEGAGGDARA
ncbi:MAG: glycosyltransferase family 39 protein [Chthonomonadales bacterium]